MVLCCLFWCQSFGDVSPYACSYYFYSVWVTEWQSFRKELTTRSTIYSLRILTIRNLSYFPFSMAGYGF